MVIIPCERKEFNFDVLFVNGDDETTVRFGSALRRTGIDGNYLRLTMDCPGLAAHIIATMSLKPSRDGIYTLKWVRHERRAKTI